MSCRVVHLTSVHQPFDTRIFHKQCRSLAQAGFDVTLVAPSDSSGIYGDNLRLVAVPLPRNRCERAMRTIRQVYRAAVREDADIYHFHDPELIPAGVLLKLRGKRVIYDVHEDYAVSMRGKQWLPAFLYRPAAIAVRLCERTLASVCDRIIAATPVIGEKFSPQKMRLAQNFPWANELAVAESQPYAAREPIVAYVGALADTRGLREMTEAVAILSREIPVKLITGGKIFSGARAEQTQATAFLEHRGMLNRAEVAKLLAEARIGIVVLHPTGNYVNSQPTKLFEYMSAGLPVVASNFPIWRNIVEGASCGLVVDPMNPRAIANALLWLLRHPSEAAAMGENGRRAVAERYTWEREAERLIATYEELRPASQVPSALGVFSTH